MKDKIQEFYDILKLDREKSAWSRATTFKNRISILVEEIKEMEEALANEGKEELRSELGDVLFGVLYLILISEEKSLFSGKEVVQDAIDKLTRRKPWIFTSEKLSEEEEVRRWVEAKAKEKLH